MTSSYAAVVASVLSPGVTLRWRPILIAATIVLAVALPACGGGGGDQGDAVDDDIAEEVPRLQPGNRPVRFRLDTSVSPETQAFLVETLEWAHVDMGDSGPLTVHVYSDEDHFVDAYTNEFAISTTEARAELEGGQFVFASPGGHVWVYLPNFEADPPAFRRLAIFHEYFHTVQHWLAEVRFQSIRVEDRSFVPRWLVEGSAEYFSIKAGDRRGLVPEADERAFRLALAKQSEVPLMTFETAGQASFIGGGGEAYTVGWLASERLATLYGADKLNREFWVSLARLRNWDTAFTEAFGVSPAAFYADFESYRRTL
jgi:hypothetical protein